MWKIDYLRLRRQGKLTPSYWRRYIDNGFGVWENMVPLANFTAALNSAHHLLTFSVSQDNQSVDYLDLTLFKDMKFTSTGKLESRLYRKPCDSLAPLPYHSAHPPSIFKGIFMGEVTRLIRNTSDADQFARDLRCLANAFLERGYPRQRIMKWLSTVYYRDRDKLIRGKHKSFPWSTYLIYHPGLPLPLIDEALHLQEYPFTPRITFKPPPSLQNSH